MRYISMLVGFVAALLLPQVGYAQLDAASMARAQREGQSVGVAGIPGMEGMMMGVSPHTPKEGWKIRRDARRSSPECRKPGQHRTERASSRDPVPSWSTRDSPDPCRQQQLPCLRPGP